MDLRGGISGRKNPQRYRGCELSILVTGREDPGILCRRKTEEAGVIGWASADHLRRALRSGRHLEQGRRDCFHAGRDTREWPLSSVGFGWNPEANQQAGPQPWRRKPSVPDVSARWIALPVSGS